MRRLAHHVAVLGVTACGTLGTSARVAAADPPEWADLTPPEGAKQVYLAGDGDDTNPCTHLHPCRTIRRGVSLLNEGSADQLLLKRGDTWEGESFGEWKVSGKTSGDRMVIGSWGDEEKAGGDGGAAGGAGGGKPEKKPRPRIVMPPGVNGMSRYRTGSTGKLIITGIHFESAKDHEWECDGIQWLGGPDYEPAGGTNILIEDCRFTRLFRGVEIQGVTDLVVRRCVFEDMGSRKGEGYSPAAMYSGKSRNVSVEECYVLSHFFGGEHREPYVQDSAFYLQDELKGTVSVRRTMIVYAGAYGPVGVQMRCPGVIEDCVFYGCHTAIDLGQVSNGDWAEKGISGRVSGNVILHGVNMNAKEERAIGILVSNTGSFTIADNIIAGKGAKSAGTGVDVDPSTRGAVRGLVVEGNILFNWNGLQVQKGAAGVYGAKFIRNQVQNPDGVSAENPLVEVYDDSACTFTGNVYGSALPDGAWFKALGRKRRHNDWKRMEKDCDCRPARYPEPGRDLASYSESVGLPRELDAAMGAMAKQSRESWDRKWEAGAVLGYLRAGFGKEPRMDGVGKE